MAATGALLADIYLFFRIDSFDSITVNGIIYLKDSEEYASGIVTLKKSFLFSGLLSVVVLYFSMRTIVRRYK